MNDKQGYKLGCLDMRTWHLFHIEVIGMEKYLIKTLQILVCLNIFD